MKPNLFVTGGFLMNLTHKTFLSALLLAALSSCGKPQDTVAFYNEDAGARAEKMVACLAGADDRNSPGCRNANLSELADKRIVQRVADLAAVENYRASADKVASPERTAKLMVENLDETVRVSNCVALNEGKPQPDVQNVIKAAVDEKLIEPVSGNKFNFEVTKKGAQFLKSQGENASGGNFCPLGFKYKDNVKMLEGKNLTQQYKGQMALKNYKIESADVNKIAFDIENTKSTVWFQKQASIKPAYPAEGKAVFEVLFITGRYRDKRYNLYQGWFGTIDGKPFVVEKGYKNMDELLAKEITKE